MNKDAGLSDNTFYNGANTRGYGGVCGAVNVPNITNSPAGDMIDPWVGIGNNVNLIQCGFQDFSEGGEPAKSIVWAEDYSSIPNQPYYGSNQVPLKDANGYTDWVNPGDSVTMETWINTAGTKMYFDITDGTTGASSGFIEWPMNMPGYSNNFAQNDEVEWINEYHYNNPMANYGTLNWTLCWYAAGLNHDSSVDGMDSNPYAITPQLSKWLDGHDFVSPPTGDSSFFMTFLNP